MDILYLLVPLSVLLMLGILVLFGWALHGGQFDDLEAEGQRMLDSDQAPAPAAPEQSRSIRQPLQEENE